MFRRFPSAVSNSFSQVVVVDTGTHSTMYLSGHVGLDSSNKVTSETFEDEARLCFAHVQNSLEKAGAQLGDVVRITAYLTDLSDYPAFTKVSGENFPNEPPASSAIQVSGLLANARLEVDAIAVIKHKTLFARIASYARGFKILRFANALRKS